MLKPRKNQPSRPSITLLKPILLRALRPEEEGGERRGKRERIERGDGRRDRNGQRKLAEKLTRDPAHERRRDEDRAQHERDGDEGATDFIHRLARRVARAQAVLDVMLDGFHHYDGVIDHDADREHDAEERDVVN